MLIRNKRAQIGESMTWLVATIIIIVILTAFIFATSAIAKGASIFSGGKLSSQRISIVNPSFVDYKASDLSIEKSFSAYLLTVSKDKIKIYDSIVAEGNLNSDSGGLAKRIFWFIYVSRDVKTLFFIPSGTHGVGIFSLDYNPSDESKSSLDGIGGTYRVLKNDFFNPEDTNLGEKTGFGDVEHLYSRMPSIYAQYDISNNKKIIFRGVTKFIAEN